MDQVPKGAKPGEKQEPSTEPKATGTRRCFRCNGDHDATSCGFRNAECHFCKRKGHIVRACRQKEQARSRAKSDNKRPGKLGRSGVYGLYHIASGLSAFIATVTVNGQEVLIGVRTYTQQPVQIVGKVEVLVKYNGRVCKLPLLVKKGSGISILGRDWFQPLCISLEGLLQLNGAPVSKSSSGEGQPAVRKVVTSVKTLLEDHPNVF
ncbi:uncharacterized protein LOC121837946 [Ixodes scapularis]|uniref:uncharacterized protein LOC121837946 n=1 Tax=Ixodes scapularis TaxID=6945 RepID=UPI001C38C920|nr:uncharacterized protein LOC121837946 [Ixodes scapularis]